MSELLSNRYRKKCIFMYLVLIMKKVMLNVLEDIRKSLINDDRRFIIKITIFNPFL